MTQHEDVKIIATEPGYSGFYSIEKITLKNKLFAGGWSEPYQRELIKRRNAVAAILYDPKLEKVVLIRQLRIGALAGTERPWLLEVVAGLIDKDKTALETITQEIEEETGLKAEKLIPIYEYWSSPGGSSEMVSLYCATVDATNAGGVYGNQAEHEDIMVEVLDVSEAFAAARTGRINNATAIIALQWLELNINKLTI